MDSVNDVNMTRVEVLGDEPQIISCKVVLRKILSMSSHGRHPKLHDAAKLILDVLEEGGFMPSYDPQLQLILPGHEGESSSKPDPKATAEYDLGKNEGL